MIQILDTFRILLTPKKVECVSLHRLIYQACEGKLDPNFGVIRVDSDHFFNRTYRVVTIEDQPFVIKSVDPKTGAVSWSGFSIDLLEILAKKINFRYDLYEGTDYGSLRPTGPNGTMKWSGLVGDVESGRADFAVSAMTVTPQREQVVDFTKRYMGEFKISGYNFELPLDSFKIKKISRLRRRYSHEEKTSRFEFIQLSQSFSRDRLVLDYCRSSNSFLAALRFKSSQPEANPGS